MNVDTLNQELAHDFDNHMHMFGTPPRSFYDDNPLSDAELEELNMPARSDFKVGETLTYRPSNFDKTLTCVVLSVIKKLDSSIRYAVEITECDDERCKGLIYIAKYYELDKV